MQTLRIVPHLRSSVVEEMPAGQVLLFTSRRDDADARLLADPRVRPFTWRALAAAARDPELALVEVAEPLWLGEWRRAVRYLAVVKLLRALRAGRRGRRRVLAATYAIDNADVRERAGSRAGVLALGLSVLLLDRIVFGTTGAAENYRSALGWALRRVRHAVLPPRIATCSVCGPGGDGPREPTVLFLGAPSGRKGFDVLMAAWERSGAAGDGWRLVVADPEGALDRPVPPGVSVTAPSRDAVHGLLRSAAVVAMPSVRRPGWREQIGLPLVEGLAHGARVVTTTETGLAADLAGHPRVVFTVPGDAVDLAAGLRRAMEPPRPAATPAGYAGHTKADVVGWWLSPAQLPG